MSKGKAFDIHAAGMLALDVARVEAGLLLIDVDFHGSQEGATSSSQRYTPFEMGLGRLVALDKGRFVGQDALREEAKDGPGPRDRGPRDRLERRSRRSTSGSRLAPQIPAAASRVAVPVYRDGEQVGKATSTTWSPTLKKMIALATVARGSHTPIGTRLEMEYTVEAVRHRVAGDRRQDAVLQSRRGRPRRRSADRASSRRRRADGSLGPRDPRLLRRGGPARRGLDDPGALVRGRPRRRARAPHRLLAHLADGRPRSTSSRSPGSTSRRCSRASPSSSCAARTACSAAFFNVCRHHAAAVMTEADGQGADPALPVPRLDLLARGRAQGHAGLRRRLRLRQGQERPRAGRDGRLGEVRLRAARRRAGPSLEQSLGPLVGQFAKLDARALPVRRAAALDLRVQLEGLRRQLPRRRLPRAAPPQGPRPRPRLQPVHDRDRRQLVPAVEPDRPHERRGRRGRRARRARRRSTTGSTRTSWSTGTRA